MIYRKSVILTLFIICNSALAQIQRNTGEFSGGIYPGAPIESFSAPTKAYPEENYLQEDWMFGSIDLMNTDHLDIKQIPMKFNVVSNRLEIKTERVVKEIPVSLIRSIEILNPNSLTPTRLINGSQIGRDSETFYEELNTEGRFNAYILHSHNVLPPDYNAQFDTGSKVARVVMVQTYFVRDKNTSELYEVKLKKKSLIKVIGKIDASSALKIKKYNGNVTDKYELQKLLIETQI